MTNKALNVLDLQKVIHKANERTMEYAKAKSENFKVTSSSPQVEILVMQKDIANKQAEYLAEAIYGFLNDTVYVEISRLKKEISILKGTEVAFDGD